MRSVKIALVALCALLLLPASSWQVVARRFDAESTVREIDSELSLIFQQKRSRFNSSALRIIFRSDAPETPTLRKNNSRHELTVRYYPGWAENTRILSAIISVLLCEKAGVEPQILPMPDLLIAGIQGYLRHLSNSGLVNRRNRYAPVSRALLRRGAKLTIPEHLYDHGKSSDPALLAWQEELAQLSLRGLAMHGIPKEQLKELLADPSSWSVAALVAKVPGDREEFLRMAMEKFACHRYSAMPPELALQKWCAVSSIAVPVIDDEADDNGEKTTSCQTVKIASLLPFIAERPDRREIIASAVRELKLFKMLLDKGAADAVDELIYSLNLGDADKSAAAAEKVENIIRSEIRVEAQLDELIDKIPALYPNFPLRLYLIRDFSFNGDDSGKALLDTFDRID